jgi:hypothetical protein
MSGGSGPPPKGQAVGILRCVYKSTPEEGRITVTFNTRTAGTAIFHMSEEEAEYYVVGQSYLFTATTP